MLWTLEIEFEVVVTLIHPIGSAFRTGGVGFNDRQFELVVAFRITVDRCVLLACKGFALVE